MSTNQERSDVARAAIDRYTEVRHGDPVEADYMAAFTDLLADLHHLYDTLNEDEETPWDRLLELAHSHYVVEACRVCLVGDAEAQDEPDQAVDHRESGYCNACARSVSLALGDRVYLAQGADWQGPGEIIRIALDSTIYHVQIRNVVTVCNRADLVPYDQGYHEAANHGQLTGWWTEEVAIGTIPVVAPYEYYNAMLTDA